MTLWKEPILQDIPLGLDRINCLCSAGAEAASSSTVNKPCALAALSAANSSKGAIGFLAEEGLHLRSEDAE
jgi:hypothetical protein